VVDGIVTQINDLEIQARALNSRLEENKMTTVYYRKVELPHGDYIQVKMLYPGKAHAAQVQAEMQPHIAKYFSNKGLPISAGWVYEEPGPEYEEVEL
jgi:hypothetical protein